MIAAKGGNGGFYIKLYYSPQGLELFAVVVLKNPLSASLCSAQTIRLKRSFYARFGYKATKKQPCLTRRARFDEGRKVAMLLWGEG